MNIVRVGMAVVLLAVGGLCSEARGQQLTEAPVRASMHAVTSWTTADGLPVNYVRQITQTPDGYLWMATDGGLVRFDGMTFEVFTRKQIDGWTTSNVAELYRGGGNALWLVSRSQELAYYQDGQFTTWPEARVLRFAKRIEDAIWLSSAEGLIKGEDGTLTSYTPRDGLPSPDVTDVHRDEAGQVWVGTPSGLVRLSSGGPVVYRVEDGLPTDNVLKIYEDARDQLWVLTEDGLARWSGETFTPHGNNALFNGPVQSAFVDRDHVLCVFTESRVIRVKGGVLRSHPLPGAVGNVRDWAKTEGGVLWVAHRQGLLRIDDDGATPVGRGKGVTSMFSALRVDRQGDLWAGAAGQGLMHLSGGDVTLRAIQQGPDVEAVTSIFEDVEGNIWVGTDAGLLRVTRRKFMAYTPREGLPEGVVFSIHGDQEGGLWLGTWGGGVQRLSSAGRTTYAAPDGLPSSYVRALEEGEDGHMWVGAERTVVRLPGGATYSVDDGGWVRAILQDQDGTLWVGGNSLLARMTEQTLERVRPDGIGTVATVWALHEDQAGRLWVATEDGLLWKEDGAWGRYTTEDGLTSNFVVTVYEERDGTLWFGTQGSGLNRFEEGRFVSYTIQDGLPSGGVWGILEDGRGRFWMSSNAGLFRVPEKELDAFAEGRAHRIAPVVYTEADGLPSAEFNRAQPPAWEDREGRLWFPTIKGAVIVDPHSVPKNTRPPPVHIETVQVNGRPVQSQGHRAFHPSSENLAFHYAALSLTAPEQNRYQYKLDGHDEEWVDAGHRRTAFYTNLPPGRYTFRVRAANGDGVWNEAGASYSFRLRPFFYETTWFYLLSLGGALLLLGGAYHVRVRHIREQELEQEVQNRTQRLQEEKEKTERQAETLKEQAKKLQELDRLKSRFFANISHDFRTPLSLVLGPLRDLLGEEAEALGPETRQQLQVVRRGAERLEGQVEQLLELAALDTGDATLQRRWGDLVAFTRDEVQAFAPVAERRSIRLDFRSAPDRLEVAFDPEKLSAALRNLLSNALKFTPEGGAVRVSVDEEEQEAVLRVRDNGPGIPEDYLDHIFDRFYQVDGSTTREHEGMGIGLSIVKELIALHEGTIDVESEPGFGTEFVVQLPKAVDPEIDKPGADEAAEDDVPVGHRDASADRPLDPSMPGYFQSSSRAEGKEGSDDGIGEPDGDEVPAVLVVEDNAEVRGYLRHILSDLYRIIEAEDGLEALERIKEERPALVLSDIMMPEMDGIELCEALKQNEELQDVPVILLTARAGEMDEVEGFEGGADDYIEKPFDSEVLKTRIRSLIARRRSLRERLRREVVVQPRGVTVTSEEEAFLQEAQSVAEDHLHERHFTVEAFAAEMNLSKSQLTRKLKKVSAFTPGAFVRELRLKRAAQLFEERFGGVAKVARRVGYADTDHFSRLFRERFGTSPSAYPPAEDA